MSIFPGPLSNLFFMLLMLLSSRKLLLVIFNFADSSWLLSSMLLTIFFLCFGPIMINPVPIWPFYGPFNPFWTLGCLDMHRVILFLLHSFYLLFFECPFAIHHLLVRSVLLSPEIMNYFPNQKQFLLLLFLLLLFLLLLLLLLIVI